MSQRLKRKVVYDSGSDGQDSDCRPLSTSTLRRSTKRRTSWRDKGFEVQKIGSSLRISEYDPNNINPKSVEDLQRVFGQIDKQAPSSLRVIWTEREKKHTQQAFTATIKALHGEESEARRESLLRQLEKTAKRYVDNHIERNHKLWAKLLMQIIAITFVRKNDIEFLELRQLARGRLYKLMPLRMDEDESGVKKILTAIEHQLDDLKGDVVDARRETLTRFRRMDERVDILEEKLDHISEKIDRMATLLLLRKA
ncbi:hypothetical protein BGX26_004456 [Mortierella sp. AD094]|nr:hypothetical protein BGX26_004456 [Mortierella sp. AD094]